MLKIIYSSSFLLVIITIIYSLLAIGLFFNVSGWNLKLNEIGDFVAGAFGPVALFWLIVGYYQQRVELRNSHETLKLQAKELKASVEEQKKLAAPKRSN